MTTDTNIRKSNVGELRPSQALTTFGVGSIIDLPNLSVMVMGLDDWPTNNAEKISEERLLLSVQRVLGSSVRDLLTPPRGPEMYGRRVNPFDPEYLIGIPVAPFPRWVVCTRCRLLAPLSSGLFQPKVEPYRPDRTRYVHNCTTRGAPPPVVPARFLVACANGHLDDFPWLDFVHRGKTDCKGPLAMYERGPSGEAADIMVRCKKCKIGRPMAQAFGRDNEKNMPACRARRPHTRDFDSRGCDVEHVRPILQGASNSWFAVMISTLSIPRAANRLAQLIDDNWPMLQHVTSKEVLEAFRNAGSLKDFVSFENADVWKALKERMKEKEGEPAESDDVKLPEWEVFRDPESAPESRNLKLRAVDVPDGYEEYLEKIVLAERLREVRALVGFTRIESPYDFDTPSELPPERRVALSRSNPTWVPACETRGEGVFFQFSEKALKKWLKQTEAYNKMFERAHRNWRASKGMDPDTGYPGMRYFLLHTFAHAIIRQLSIESGYSIASISERIYCSTESQSQDMAGVLIYTSAPDSEGTLGGLCALGEPKRLGSHLDRALDQMALCGSDPLCAEHEPGQDVSLHGAACHTCCFLPETSCEKGNKYLDRAVIVDTVQRTDTAFFRR